MFRRLFQIVTGLPVCAALALCGTAAAQGVGQTSSSVLGSFSTESSRTQDRAGALSSTRIGEVVRVVPDVFLERAQQRQPVQEHAPLQLQDTIRTVRYARARLRMDDGAVLNLGAESRLVFSAYDLAGTRTLELQQGHARASVFQSPAAQARFELRTPNAIISTAGGHFAARNAGDHTEVLCLTGEASVRSSDASATGEVTLKAGQLTRVYRLRAPTPPEAASPQETELALDQTNIAAGPFQWARAELSWPPADCAAGAHVAVRAWVKEKRADGEAEVPLDADLVSGTLRLGPVNVDVVDGRVMLPPSVSTPPADARFAPRSGADAVPAAIWPPPRSVAGQGWLAPRAVLGGRPFYIKGPLGSILFPALAFDGQPAAWLWTGSCGAGFRAPETAGREYEVALSASGRPLARGRMSLVEINLRRPTPATRGKTTNFGIDLLGLLGLAPLTQGRPVVTARFINRTPQLLGNLKSGTKNARVVGQEIQFVVRKGNIGNAGVARLNGSGRSLGFGGVTLGVEINLDDALEDPHTPMTPVSQNR